MNLKPVELTLPHWMSSFLQEWEGGDYSTPESRMRLSIALSKRNIEEKTGGPFGAAIFQVINGEYRLLSVGVNRVVPGTNPTSHGEMVAYQFACREIGSFSLGLEGMPPAVLSTSAEMCGMCLTGLNWAGIKRVEWAASSQDVEETVGFDEGFRPENVTARLQEKGIEVLPNVLRGEAVTVLADYAAEVEAGKAVLYNGNTGSLKRSSAKVELLESQFGNGESAPNKVL